MRINTNVSALTAFNNLAKTQNAVSDSMQKLSSGFRINKAADDAAGLGIANKLRADGRALTQASRNAEQTNTLLGVAEGSADTIQSILERMKELATQAGSDTVDQSGRDKITAEYGQLRDEIKRTTATTVFNGAKLLDGTFSASVTTGAANSVTGASGQTYVAGVGISGVAAGTYYVTASAANKTFTIGNASTVATSTVLQTVSASSSGAQNLNFDKFGITLSLNASYVAGTSAITVGTKDQIVVAAGTGGNFLVGSSGNYTSAIGDNVTISNLDLTTDTLGLTTGGGSTDVIDLGTSSGTARTALAVIDTALGKVGTALGSIGSSQNRVGYALDNVKTAITNFASAESVIRDVDMAEEMTKFSKNQILAQAGTAMLAQANQMGQGVLKLLQ